MTIRTLAATAVALASLAPPAAAQSSDPFRDANADLGAVEARLSLRIPFGSQPDAAESAPQLDFGVRREMDERITLDSWQLVPPPVRETRLGFTLSDSPTLVLDGRAYGPMTAEEAELLGLPRPVVAGAAVIGAAALTLVVLYACCAEFDGED